MGVKKFEDVPLSVKVLCAGAAACTADLVTFPLDTAKVRLQVQGEGTQGVAPRFKGVFQTVALISKEEGPKALYNGLNAGLQRQLAFSSIRLGLYEPVKTFYQNLTGADQRKSKGLTILSRICAGVTTGALAVIFAQPTDVVKIRFQAQQGKEKRYNSTWAAYKTIHQVEGVPGLWKGTVPNVVRSAIVNVAEIVCYDIVKGFILERELLADNVICHFVSAVIAGFATTVTASPVDVVKTRYMNSPPGRYRSAIHCTVETFRKEGPMAFYKGFKPSFVRFVSWNIVLWVTYEKIKYFTTKILKDDADD